MPNYTYPDTFYLKMIDGSPFFVFFRYFFFFFASASSIDSCSISESLISLFVFVYNFPINKVFMLLLSGKIAIN